MKVELHLHTKRYSGCATATPEELMQRLTDCGYGAVYVTEHDAVWPDAELDELRGKFPKLHIYPGLERSIGTSDAPQHLLVLGSNDPGYLLMKDPAEIITRAMAEGDLTILAHPFRWENGAGILDKGLFPDAMEFRTCNQDAEAGAVAAQTAQRLGIPLVNAGDTHGLHFLDRFWIEVDRPLVSSHAIRGIVVDRAYRNCSSE